MKQDTLEPLQDPSLPFISFFLFLTTSTLLIFPSFSLKLNHLRLVRSLNADTLDGT